MKKAGDVLRGFLGDEHVALAGKWSTFFSGWQKLVGTDIAAHSRVIDVKRGVVIVEVDHPGWLQVLHMKKTKVLIEMKKRYPALGIENIRIFVSDKKKDEEQKAGDTTSENEASTKTAIDKRQVENTEEYRRFKAMLKRLRNTDCS